jgi:hypothetical protein
MKTVGLFLMLAFVAASVLAAETIEITADPALHGEYPKKYQEIITNWLATALVDAPSAQIEWVTPPKPGSMPEKKGGKPLFGYIVEFKVNSRNRFGAYTGMQKHKALIHDGQVIKVTGFGF